MSAKCRRTDIRSPDMQHESQLSSPDAPETVELELYAGVEDFRAKYELPSNMLLLCVALVHFNQPVSGRESQQAAKSFPGLLTRTYSDISNSGLVRFSM